MTTTATPTGAHHRPPEANWLVIIDHREARIYRSVAPGAVPQQIRPHVPEALSKPPTHAGESSRGHDQPDPQGYFEPVAGVLNGAGQILIFGTGTGHSSEMDQFITWLKATRPAVAGRIIGAEVVDQHQLSEGQLLAKARDIYANGRVV